MLLIEEADPTMERWYGRKVTMEEAEEISGIEMCIRDRAYAMTGWRLGYACAPETILKQMLKIHQFAIMCAPTTSQYAADVYKRQGQLYLRGGLSWLYAPSPRNPR